MISHRALPHSGEGEDFLTHFFTRTAITRKLKAEKSLLDSNHDREKLCKQKSIPFQNKYQSLSKVWVFFFWKNTEFWPKKYFSAKQKNGRFSVIPAGTKSVVIVGQFLMALTVPPSFVDDGPKLRGTYNSEVTQVRNGQKMG